MSDRRVELGTGGDEVRKGLEDGQVGADVIGNLLLCSVVRDEFFARWHVDTVNVGEAVQFSLRLASLCFSTDIKGE